MLDSNRITMIQITNPKVGTPPGRAGSLQTGHIGGEPMLTITHFTFKLQDIAAHTQSRIVKEMCLQLIREFNKLESVTDDQIRFAWMLIKSQE